ncbi:hypothetical protein AVEN_196072-1 [Araneus ventricosus]|uniref:Uncharacterized protein n=1 Tax=Araneus ventricosus TaxID=182803 RepID=A0A4Y2R4H7_ARAVE|nr:hypothetical protein AVEN_196072-1 [Araneus ventricosus]
MEWKGEQHPPLGQRPHRYFIHESEIDELIKDKLFDANLSDDEDVIPPSFKDAMDSIENLRTHFFCQKNSEDNIQ